MKLGFIRTLAAKYDKVWDSEQNELVANNEIAMTRLRIFLSKFQYMDDEHELSSRDLTGLMRIMVQNQNSALVKKINYIFDKNLLTLAEYLDKHKLLSSTNFSIIYNMDTSWLLLLNDLISNPDGQEITLSQELIRALDQVHSNNHGIMMGKECHLLKELHHAGLLNQYNIELIQKLSIYEINYLGTIISSLNHTHVSISKDALETLCAIKDHLSDIKELVITLENSSVLSKEIFEMLLNQDSRFYSETSTIIKNLQKNNILSVETFIQVKNNPDKFSLGLIIEILSNNQVLLNNSNALLKLSTIAAQHKDIKYSWWKLYGVIKNLHEIKLLNDPLLFEYLEVMTKNSSYTASKILDEIIKAKLNLSMQQLIAIFRLPEKYLDNVKSLLINLDSHHLLNTLSIEKVIRSASDKMSPPTRVDAIKHARKETHAARSGFHTTNKFHLFAEHKDDKKYLSGGFGKVKKCYDAETDGSVIFALKKFDSATVSDQLSEAKREVKYNQLLKHNAFYFQHKKNVYVATDWFSEKSLDAFINNKKEITEQPVRNRLLWVISGLSDLNVLHSRYRLHGDIKPSNFVVNRQNNSMKLIDFGSAHKACSNKSYACTPYFLDDTLTYNYSYDMYLMGVVIAYIFPELFNISEETIKDHKKRVKVEMIFKDGIQPVEHAIQSLVQSVIQPEKDMRPTCDDALKYCWLLSNNFAKLDERLLSKISSLTINRSTLTEEDILHGINSRKTLTKM